MTELFAESSRAIPLVSVTISFRAGAVHDPAGRAGLARIVARMLRRGCRGLGSEQIEERLDALGAELGAGAGLGATSVHFECLARSIQPVAELVATLLAQPTFDEEELGRLKRQTEAEIIESRDSDSLLAGRALRRHLFAGHPHATRVAGSVSTVQQVCREDAARWHAAHFNRANAVVAVVGDVSAAEVEQLSAALTAGLPEGERTAYPTVEPTPPSGRHLVIVDKPERTQTQMVIGSLGSHPRDPDHVALIVANTAFGGTFTARMVQEIRAKRGWSYGASSHLATGRVRDAFTMWTAPAATDAAACLALELELLARWREEGITDEELAFCQSYLARSFAFELETPKKRVGLELERCLLELPADYHDRFVERVGAITREQASDAVRARIAPDRLWVSVVGTEAEVGADVRGAIERLGTVVVDPHDLE